MNFDDWTIKRRPCVKVLGVGDAGAVALQLIAKEQLENVECIAINTHSQNSAASTSIAELVIGPAIVHGLGSGGNPELGRAAANESRLDLEKILADTLHTFVVGGMGGGTGTGAVPGIAQIAAELEARVTLIVSQPFTFEGSRRFGYSHHGIYLLPPLAHFVGFATNHLSYFAGRGHTTQTP